MTSLPINERTVMRVPTAVLASRYRLAYLVLLHHIDKGKRDAATIELELIRDEMTRRGISECA